METFSALLAICAENSPVPSEFPAQRPVTRSFDVFFDLRLNKRLSKQSWGWWSETPSSSLWRHRNELKRFSYYWSFIRRIHRPRADSPQKWILLLVFGVFFRVSLSDPLNTRPGYQIFGDAMMPIWRHCNANPGVCNIIPITGMVIGIPTRRDGLGHITMFVSKRYITLPVS